MKRIFCLFAGLAFAGSLSANIHPFSQDRAAILGMAGRFEVTFEFEEVIALAEGYELKPAYQTKAHELVKVVEDTGRSITLQHLLLVDGGLGPEVIKHWAQIWVYEDSHTLDFEGNRTWLVRNHSAETTAGSWTQFVTQVDDSPRYKAQGHWSHQGNLSVWTSAESTRPLPRREHTKRSDYDLLVVENQHLITPDGWVHQQDNRKLVSRDGRQQFLCVERGMNHYRRLKGDEEEKGFLAAEEEWAKVAPFWTKVRHHWLDLTKQAPHRLRYEARVEGKTLMSTMSKLADSSAAGEEISAEKIAETIGQFLR